MNNITVYYLITDYRKEVDHMYWITGVLGFVLVASPFLLGYADNVGALWTSMIAGVLVMMLSFMESVVKEEEKWEYRIAALIGIGVILAPFLLRFANNNVAMWTTVLVGGMVAAFAGLRSYTIHK